MNNPLRHQQMKAHYYIIKLERERQGYSQRELAKKAGVSVPTLIRAEQGREIYPSTWRKVREALGI